MITWTRTTTEQATPVRLQHGDHLGTVDGQPVACLTRMVNGRWWLWLPEPKRPRWKAVGSLQSLALLKSLAETAPRVAQTEEQRA